MSEFVAACLSAVPGVVVSTLASGVVLYYIRGYIDKKLTEEEKKQEQIAGVKRERYQLEMQRRQALGRLLFWMHRGVVNPPPNGELEKAMESFNAVEAKQREVEQKLLAGLLSEEDI